MVYIYKVEYNLAIKKDEIMLFAATWMDLEIIILSELSQAKTNIMILLLCGIFKKIHKLIHKTEKDAQI